MRAFSHVFPVPCFLVLGEIFFFFWWCKRFPLDMMYADLGVLGVLGVVVCCCCVDSWLLCLVQAELYCMVSPYDNG